MQQSHYFGVATSSVSLLIRKSQQYCIPRTRSPYRQLFCFMIIMISTIVTNFAFRGSRGWIVSGSVSLPSKRLYRIYSSTVSSSGIVKLESPSLTLIDHPAYDRVDDLKLPEFGLSGAIYKHKKSGAQVISLVAPSDENKVFGITFRTPPSDSTGVPHILEHSVLCGSKRFPVKEPFLDLLKGSLQNFLNAMTYPDRTCYPVASTNLKDFYNLIHVYLDAVLNPRAVNDPQVLQQEGWHYELDDSKDPLKIKGVVYNEMKGVYSSPDALMGRAAQQALFPHNTYGVDSGGDPDRIPDLTFDGFKKFHQNYYHPSNSRVFFYGDDDQFQRLQLLDEYLKDFDRIPVRTQVQYQPPLVMSQKKIAVPFPIAAGTEPKHMITVNWVLNHQDLSAKEMLILEVLDYLLLGTSTSSLRKALVESNLGESVTGGGLSDELIQASFAAGLKGVKRENVDKVQELVQSTLENLSKVGFEEEAIQAAMNTLEFRMREFNTGDFPKGLAIMLGMMKKWIYDKNPADGVLFEAPLQALKDDLKAGKPVFEEAIKKFLIANEHRVAVEMVPDSELEARQAAEEEERLAKIKASKSDQELVEIVELTKLLKEAQEREDSAEAKATLPKLGLEDIDRLSKELPIEVTRDSSVTEDYTLVTHPIGTNGILYADVALDYSSVAIEDLELLPLFARMLMEAGTKNFDETTLSRRIGTNTGGISVSFYNDFIRSAGSVADPDNALLYLLVRGKATQANIPMLFELFEEILLNAKLDNQKRAVEMLRESKARKESSVLTSGHSFAATRLGAQNSFLGYLGECTGGLSSVRSAGKLLEDAEKNWPQVQARLERIRSAIVRSSKSKERRVLINLTADKSILEASQPVIEKFYSALPHSAAASSMSLLDSWKAQKTKLLLPSRNEAFVIPSLVNYVAMGGAVYGPGEKVSAATSVASRYLSTGYMWDNVRVLGGAYGGFARFSEVSGRFSFLSYRDPNLLNTLQVYENADAFLSEQSVSSEELLQTIIGAIGELDSPMSPDQKGFSSFSQFLTRESAADRQQYRDEVLQTSQRDFSDLAQRLKKMRETRASVVVFGSQQAIDQANAELPEGKKLAVEPAFGAQSSSSSSSSSQV